MQDITNQNNITDSINQKVTNNNDNIPLSNSNKISITKITLRSSDNNQVTSPKVTSPKIISLTINNLNQRNDPEIIHIES